MSRPVFVIGFDGFDREVVERYRAELPTLDRLMKNGTSYPVVSTFPPDSTTAWATIYTGKGPGAHGIVDFVDPLEKVAKLSTTEQGSDSLRGNTFWDCASRAGKRVAVIFPHMGYPTWEVNGKMFGRSTVIDATDAHPPGCCDRVTLESLNVLKRFPGSRHQAKKFLLDAENLVRKEFAFAERVAAEERWDLIFFYSSTLDLVEHFFWPTKTLDVGAPVLHFYRLYDKLLGELLLPYEDSHAIVIISDHGHGARPNRIVNVNEILRQMGVLAVPSGKARIRSRAISRVQKTAMRVVSTFSLENFARSILKMVPVSRKMFTNPTLFDAENSKAYLSDFSGVKAYAYGGIRLHSALSSVERSSLSKSVIQRLSDVRDPATGELVFQWVRPREEVIGGEFSEKYPDLLFLLRHPYGAGRDVNVPVVFQSTDRQLVPGSHRIETPLCLIIHSSEKMLKPTTLEDVASVILDLMDLPMGELATTPRMMEARLASGAESGGHDGRTISE